MSKKHDTYEEEPRGLFEDGAAEDGADDFGDGPCTGPGTGDPEPEDVTVLDCEPDENGGDQPAAEIEEQDPDATSKPGRAVIVRRPAERQEFLARFVQPDAMQALKVAHRQFFGALADPGLSVPERTILTAGGVLAVQEALGGEILDKVLMPLMNHPSGFGTDRDPAKGYSGAPYSSDVVLRCASQMWLQGLPPTGGCWDIIANRAYVRKDGFGLLVGNVARTTFKAKIPAIPGPMFASGGYVTVPVTIKYKLHTAAEDAEPETFNGVYECRLNAKNRVPVEFLTGKAKRKSFRDLYNLLTGQSLGESPEDAGAGEAEIHHVSEAPPAERSASQVRNGAGK